MKKMSFWEVVLFILSIYVVAELYVASLITYSAQTRANLLLIDTMICCLFLTDFFLRLYKAENKQKYLKSNWIDFVSSIPMVGLLRIGRVVKIIRVLRVIRSGKIFFSMFSRNDSLKSLRNLGVIIFCLIVLFSISIHQLEKELNPAFSTLAEAFWWTVNTTITFSFFQDISPVSVEGKAISIILILLGMVLFGTFIGFVSDYFITEEDVHEDVKSLHSKIDGLNAKMEKLMDSRALNVIDKLGDVRKDN